MNVIYNIVCIGAGGTGTFFLKEFARFLSAFRYKDVSKVINLAIVDGDHVEEHNLERQAFIPGDINSNKAVCIAEAINSNLGLCDVRAYPQYIDTVSDIRQIFYSLKEDEEYEEYVRRTSIHIDILIGCSDNHRARQVMHEYFSNENRGTIIYYDAANEYSNGEVVFSGRHKGKLLGKPRAAYFPAILEDKSPRASEQSCGAINTKSPQHIATNMMAANLLLSRLTKLIAENKMEFGIAFFDVFEMYVTFYPDLDSIKPEENEDVKRKGKRRKTDSTAVKAPRAS